jgi:hypothetical protein
LSESVFVDVVMRASRLSRLTDWKQTERRSVPVENRRSIIEDRICT